MSVIKRLGARVEEEHSKHLSELRRLEESSGAQSNGRAENVMDFESLVRGGGIGSAKKEVPNDLWADDSPAVGADLDLQNGIPHADILASSTVHDAGDFPFAEHHASNDRHPVSQNERPTGSHV